MTLIFVFDSITVLLSINTPLVSILLTTHCASLGFSASDRMAAASDTKALPATDTTDVAAENLHPLVSIPITDLTNCAQCGEALAGIGQKQVTVHLKTARICHELCMDKYIRTLQKNVLKILSPEDRKDEGKANAAELLVHQTAILNTRFTFLTGDTLGYVIQHAPKVMLDDPEGFLSTLFELHPWEPESRMYDDGYIGFKVLWNSDLVDDVKAVGLIDAVAQAVKEEKTVARWHPSSGTKRASPGRAYLYLRFMKSRLRPVVTLVNSLIGEKCRLKLLQAESVDFQCIGARTRVFADLAHKTVCVNAQMSLETTHPSPLFIRGPNRSLYMVSKPDPAILYPFHATDIHKGWVEVDPPSQELNKN